MDMLLTADEMFDRAKAQADDAAKRAIEDLSRELARLRDDLRTARAALAQSADAIPPVARWGSMMWFGGDAEREGRYDREVQGVHVAITRGGVSHQQHLQGLTIHTKDGQVRGREVPPGKYAVVIELRRLPEDF